MRLAYAAAEFKAGRRVWSTPDVLTIEAWIARAIERYSTTAGASVPRTLSAAEDWLLWRQCAAEATRDWDLVNRSALADALRRASVLASDACIDVHQLPRVPGTEPALLQEVQRAVEERCRTLGAASLASLLGHLPFVVDTSRLRLAGFLWISPRVAALTGVERGPVTPDEGGLKRPKGVIAPDDLTELEMIARWCKAHVERRPDARILVVLPGSTGSRERLATLIRQAVDPRDWLRVEGATAETLVAIEGGSPLARDPAVAHALLTLQWLSGEAEDFEEVSEWLRAPYWKTPDVGARTHLDAWLREHAKMELDLPSLVSAADSIPAARSLIAVTSEANAALGQGRASPRDWSHRFRAALAAVGWPGERARSSGDQQTLVRFHELLDEFGQLAGVAGELSRETAVQWLCEHAARTPFQPADGDPTITITPMFVDPVVRYDAIWVAGLHSEVLPQAVQPDPFLPLPAQLAAGVPAASAGGRLEEARALLRAWRAATDELVLSAPARSEDLELLPSPLLVPWLPSHRASAKKPLSSVEPLWLPARLRRAGLLEAVHDRSGLQWDTQRPLPAGTRSLELQNTCPFRAYAELRLGSEELGAPEPGVAPTLRGNLLHAALHRFWRELGDSAALHALGEPPLGELIDQCVRDAASDLWGRGQESRALMRERRRTARLIRSLCELERQRAPFRVVGTECQMILPLGAARMDIRIDRIDQLEGGGRAVLDYKSGQRPTADWYGERPSHPQLLAYMAAVGEDVAAMATVNVTAREVRFDGIARSAELLPKVKGVIGPDGAEEGAWQLRRAEWLERVERLTAGFVAGNAAVDPKQGACDYCHVKSVCRIGDRAEPEADAIEEALDD